MKTISEIILHPVRMRIIQALSTRVSTTANELCETMSDVPRTTLYRHINVLISSKIVSVISEQKVRGSLERTLALNIPELSRHNTIENAAENAFGFLMTHYSKFHRYFNGENPDPGKDKIFLNNTVLMLDDGEFDEFLEALRQLLIQYSFKLNDNRKARDISIISSPVIDN